MGAAAVSAVRLLLFGTLLLAGVTVLLSSCAQQSTAQVWSLIDQMQILPLGWSAAVQLRRTGVGHL
jgi:hypothetical protein